MSIEMAEILSLSLLMERMLDTEVLSDEESRSLLAEILAAQRSMQQGDASTARAHVEELSLLLDRLLEAEALTLHDGRAVIQATDVMLGRKA